MIIDEVPTLVIIIYYEDAVNGKRKLTSTGISVQKRWKNDVLTLESWGNDAPTIVAVYKSVILHSKARIIGYSPFFLRCLSISLLCSFDAASAANYLPVYILRSSIHKFVLLCCCWLLDTEVWLVVPRLRSIYQVHLLLFYFLLIPVQARNILTSLINCFCTSHE